MWPLWFWIVCFLQITLNSSNDCPEPIQMQIKQENLASRPSGVVNLTCVIKGIPLSHVTAYWWILKQNEINKPLVNYYENASKISPGYTHIVEDEILTQPKGNIKSQLRLRVNTTQSRNINFSIQTKESILCGKDINITFVDPMLSIEGGEGPTHQGQVISVSCIIDKAAGKPIITLGYTTANNENGSITTGNVDIVHHGQYFSGAKRGNLTVRNNGTITCSVIDELGSYTDSTNIVMGAVSSAQQEAKPLYAYVAIPLIAIGVIAVITVIAIVLWYKRRNEPQRGQDQENSQENCKMSLLSENETPRESAILNSSSRESLVRETRSVLELVWAYNNGESERLCEELLNALKAFEMNVNKKNRKDNTSIDLSNTRGHYFVVFLWDEAARYDEAFQEISLKMEVLEHGRDDTMGIHVIMDESVNASSSNINQDYRYLMWFNEPGPKNMQALAEKIKSITQKQMSSLKGISNILEGLVWSYFAEYLKTVLVYLKEKHPMKYWSINDDRKPLHHKFLIIIPKSGKCPTMERVCAEGCYQRHSKLCKIQGDGTGMQGRRFDPKIHEIKRTGFSNKKYYFVGEFANPIDILHHLEQEDIIVDNEFLINEFEQRLCYLLDHKNHGLHGVYEIIRFDDETENHKFLNEILVPHIEYAKNIEKMPEEETAGASNVLRLSVLNYCNGTCIDSGNTCSVHRVISAMGGYVDIAIKQVTPFDFNQGGGERIFSSIQRNAMLCFIWDQHSSEKQTLHTCLDIALIQNERRTLHIETAAKALPATVRRSANTISFLNDESDGVQRFLSDLKDLWLDQEDSIQYGLVGMGLALYFYYSDRAFRMTGWEDRLKKKAIYLKNLYEKLVIIIPQSGRWLETIPGCDIIDYDKEKLTTYNTVRGNLARLESNESDQDYGAPPTLSTENRAATIYNIKDENQTYHAAVEYASPVRTLYIMRNTTHHPENPASQSLTDGWLQGEIKLLHTELTKLVADAKPEVNENIDLVYLEDGEWSNLSEDKYIKEASRLVQKKLMALFHGKGL